VSLALWLGAVAFQPPALRRARRAGPEAERRTRRRLLRVVRLEHGAFLALLTSGLWLMGRLGWGLGHPRWFGLKLGLVIFLLIPLEAMHAWIAYAWIEPGLRQTSASSFSKDLVRGIGMQEMLASLAFPLLLLAVPLLLWLSLYCPF
jgi:hypothetical protein